MSAVAKRGRFISLEGGEGVGKSTQAKALVAALRRRGIEVIETREPGGSPGAEDIRQLLLSGGEERWSGSAEALLFAAARADHVDKTIRPALTAGRWVISDRFLDSSLAYQGAAAALGIDAVRAINRFAIGEFLPDRTLVLRLADGQGGARARARDRHHGDRIGARPPAYHRAVDAAFRTIAEQEPQRVRLVDAAGTPDEVGVRLLAEIHDLLQ